MWKPPQLTCSLLPIYNITDLSRLVGLTNLYNGGHGYGVGSSHSPSQFFSISGSVFVMAVITQN